MRRHSFTYSYLRRYKKFSTDLQVAVALPRAKALGTQKITRCVGLTVRLKVLERKKNSLTACKDFATPAPIQKLFMFVFHYIFIT